MGIGHILLMNDNVVTAHSNNVKTKQKQKTMDFPLEPEFFLRVTLPCLSGN